ncbi:MAG: serine hydrolase [Bacteroidota bacterium]
MRYFLLSLSFLFVFSCGQPDPPLTLSNGSIDDPLHERQIGQLAFMSDWVEYAAFTEEKHLKTINFSNVRELNCRMYLDKTLTAHLHDLAPSMTVEELCAAGNFQFTFLVDDQPLYVSNLPTGAGSCWYKNEQTVYGIPLRGKEEMDHWGRFLWTRFWKLGGGEAALEQGAHQLTIEVRPYLDGETFKTGPVIASGSLQTEAGAVNLPPAAVAVQPIAPTSTFPISQAVFAQQPIEAINRRIAKGSYEEVTSLVVLKNGELLIEEYFNGASRTTLHDTRSVGKSFAGTLLGMAIADGYLHAVGQPLADFYDLSNYQHPSSVKAGITLEDLLTMSSTLDGNDADQNSPGHEEKMYPTTDWVRFTLNLPTRAEQSWQYCTAGVVLLGDILHQRVPGSLEAYAAERLFTPLGITDQQWQHTPTGIGNTAGSLAMSSLSYAAYGQLYLEDPQGLLPQGWASKSLSPLVARRADAPGHYGYLFWHDVFSVGDREIAVSYASGNGGNRITIIPELNAVIVLTATAYGKPSGHHQADQIVQKVTEALLTLEDAVK